MMVVIGIIGIVSAIAFPNFSAWRERQAVSSISKSLLSNLKLARVKAMAENRSVSVTFTATSYTYDADTTGNCGACKPKIVLFRTFSSALSLTPTTTRTFTSRGTVNSGSLTLSAGATSRVLNLNVIGRAYLQ